MVTIIFITYITLSQSQQNKFHIFSIFLHLVMRFTRISTFIEINKILKKEKGLGLEVAQLGPTVRAGMVW